MKTIVVAATMLLLAGCCAGPVAMPDGGPDVREAGESGLCQEFTHRCNGPTWQVCSAGAWADITACAAPQVCSPTIGCADCVPGGLVCSGADLVRCDAAGHPSAAVVRTCAPDPCVQNACVDPCSVTSLSRTYSGCVFYAVDLPQWDNRAGGGLIAAQMQYAVAVANPWPVPVDVFVDQDDGPLGGAPQLFEVAAAIVAPNDLSVIPLPAREVDEFIEGGQESQSAVTARAYRITTSRPTSAYQFNPINNPQAYSNDASLLIPATALDESYIVLGWPGHGGRGSNYANGDGRSFVTIVGTQAGTHVRVVPTTAVGAGDGVPLLMPGAYFVVTLGEFEVLNLEGGDVGEFGPTDFTGTRIEADAPVAVFSGVQCTDIPDLTQACDHIEEQLFPRSTLSTDYAVARSKARGPESDIFRILSLTDGTTVTTSLPAPDDTFSLDAGQMHQAWTGTNFTLHATNPVMVGQFLVGGQAVDFSGPGDPSFILVPPVAQFRSRYIFLVSSDFDQNWIVMSVPIGAAPTLDGAAPAGCERNSIGTTAGTAFEALRCPVGSGAHTVEWTAPFSLMVEGWAPWVSYGYPGGMDFSVVNRQCTASGDCGAGEFCSGGACVPDIPH